MPKTCPDCGTTYPDDTVFCSKDGKSLPIDEKQTDLIGMVIAERYSVKKLLGEGGMGKVYLAEHLRLPQKAAIKVLHQDMVKDSNAKARFKLEAANAARIEHDRVARVFDYGETREGFVYIAMEFVPGVTLRQLLDQEGRLGAVRAANIVYQVAEGLDAAHRLTIVHRDLKPDNILVITDDGGTDRCKVVDFGIAKATNDTGTQLTQMGMLVGTPEFMSPEQVLGEKLDGRSDVYALALVAFEMFSGGLPFEGNTPERKLTARLIQDPRTLADVAPDIEWPDALQAAFSHALQREPESRTASAVAFADAVVTAVEAWSGKSVLRGRTPMSTTAILSAAAETTGSMAKPSASGATSVASSKPVASTKSATPGASTSASKVAIPDPAPKKSTLLPIAAAAVVVLAVGGWYMFGRGGGVKSDAGSTPSTQSPVVQAPAPTTTPANQPVASNNTPQTQPSSAPQTPNVAPATNQPANASTAPTTAANTKPSVSGANKQANAMKALTPPPATLSAPTGSAPTSAADADAREARRALSAVQVAMQQAPDDQNAAVGIKSVAQLSALLPRLGTASDSAWAYLWLASAYGMADKPELACEPFRYANRISKRISFTSEQKATFNQLSGLLTCAP